MPVLEYGIELLLTALSGIFIGNVLPYSSITTNSTTNTPGFLDNLKTIGIWTAIGISAYLLIRLFKIKIFGKTIK
jgi:hypothetical protein